MYVSHLEATQQKEEYDVSDITVALDAINFFARNISDYRKKTLISRLKSILSDEYVIENEWFLINGISDSENSIHFSFSFCRTKIFTLKCNFRLSRKQNKRKSCSRRQFMFFEILRQQNCYYRIDKMAVMIFQERKVFLLCFFFCIYFEWKIRFSLQPDKNVFNFNFGLLV